LLSKSQSCSCCPPNFGHLLLSVPLLLCFFLFLFLRFLSLRPNTKSRVSLDVYLYKFIQPLRVLAEVGLPPYDSVCCVVSYSSLCTFFSFFFSVTITDSVLDFTLFLTVKVPVELRRLFLSWPARPFFIFLNSFWLCSFGWAAPPLIAPSFTPAYFLAPSAVYPRLTFFFFFVSFARVMSPPPFGSLLIVLVSRGHPSINSEPV